jgi:maleylacetoacetate isomerase
MPIILYNYFRSSAAYRVRIALDYKGIPYETQDVNLVTSEQKTLEFKSKNPQARVPFLITDEAHFGQSMAMLEYLEERYPEPALLPKELSQRAEVRYVANLVACDIHPLNNLSVLDYLKLNLHQDKDAIMTWYHHWLQQGLTALETFLTQREHQSQQFCFGPTPTVADICLVPQLYNAKRFNYDLSQHPLLLALYDYCLQFPYFSRTHPDNHAQ